MNSDPKNQELQLHIFAKSYRLWVHVTFDPSGFVDLFRCLMRTRREVLSEQRMCLITLNGCWNIVSKLHSTLFVVKFPARANEDVVTNEGMKIRSRRRSLSFSSVTSTTRDVVSPWPLYVHGVPRLSSDIRRDWLCSHQCSERPWIQISSRDTRSVCDTW